MTNLAEAHIIGEDAPGAVEILHSQYAIIHELDALPLMRSQKFGENRGRERRFLGVCFNGS
jgi:hypothetical protein